MRNWFPTRLAIALAAALCAAVPARANIVIADADFTPRGMEFSLDTRVRWLSPVIPGNPVSIEFTFKISTVYPYTPSIYPNIEVRSNGQTVRANLISEGGDYYNQTYLLKAPLVFSTPGIFDVEWIWSGQVFLDYFQEVVVGTTFETREVLVEEFVYYEFGSDECIFFQLCGWVLETYTDIQTVEVPIYDVKPFFLTDFLIGPRQTFQLLVDPITGGGSGVVGGDEVIGVPEPASLALFGAGLLGLFGLRRRAAAA
jgi:hypothetical protein